MPEEAAVAQPDQLVAGLRLREIALANMLEYVRHAPRQEKIDGRKEPVKPVLENEPGY